MGRLNPVVGKVLYGSLFCVIFPLILYWWSLRVHVPLEIPSAILPYGAAITLSGIMLMLNAMVNLWTIGKGLPMNAYPPKFYVQKGAYRLLRHPIYVSFFIFCVGSAIMLNSSSAFFIVSPIVAMLCAALVFGFEQRDIENRFDTKDHNPLFGLPGQTPITPLTRIGVLLSAFVPWIILYELLIALGVGLNYFDTMTMLDKSIPVIEMAEIPYAMTYIFVAIVPFIIRLVEQLREFLMEAWLITVAGISIQILLPFYAEPKPFLSLTILGEFINIERAYDGPAASFPSFHVMWALLAFTFWAKCFPKRKLLLAVFTTSIIISCVLTGVHSILDVVAAIIVFALIKEREKILTWTQRQVSRISNSWHAWQFGRMRVINHSMYAGLAAFSGIFIAAQFGVDLWTLLIVTLSSSLGGAVWGQLIEGSPKLLRPYGFYGALLGGVAGVLISNVFIGFDLSKYFASFALAAPWTQAVGRLRCMVQGCCHGRPLAGSGFGVTYYNEHSRVCLSGLKGRQIYNTQLYSMIFNLIIGVVLLRLVYARVDMSLVIGLYFILSGATRFIEEGYRGEIQTSKIKGLSVYQWLAIASILSGMIVTCFEAGSQVSFKPVFDLFTVFASIFAGIVWAFSMGIDFPWSNFRFSKLTG